MDNAAKNGHLDVVNWLHENRHEGCTKYAMDRERSVEAVRFLHENRSEERTEHAMGLAAEKGDLETLVYLHANSSEGCADPHHAAILALRGCNWEVFEWFCETFLDHVSLKSGSREMLPLRIYVDRLMAIRDSGSISDNAR